MIITACITQHHTTVRKGGSERYQCGRLHKAEAGLRDGKGVTKVGLMREKKVQSGCTGERFLEEVDGVLGCACSPRKQS